MKKTTTARKKTRTTKAPNTCHPKACLSRCSACSNPTRQFFHGDATLASCTITRRVFASDTACKFSYHRTSSVMMVLNKLQRRKCVWNSTIRTFRTTILASCITGEKVGRCRTTCTRFKEGENSSSRSRTFVRHFLKKPTKRVMNTWRVCAKMRIKRGPYWTMRAPTLPCTCLPLSCAYPNAMKASKPLTSKFQSSTAVRNSMGRTTNPRLRNPTLRSNNTESSTNACSSKAAACGSWSDRQIRRIG